MQTSSVGRPVAVQDVHSAGWLYALRGNKQVSGQVSEAAGDEVGQSVNTFWFLLSGSISWHCLLLPQHLDTQTTTLAGRDGQMAASKRNADLKARATQRSAPTADMMYRPDSCIYACHTVLDTSREETGKLNGSVVSPKPTKEATQTCMYRSYISNSTSIVSLSITQVQLISLWMSMFLVNKQIHLVAALMLQVCFFSRLIRQFLDIRWRLSL